MFIDTKFVLHVLLSDIDFDKFLLLGLRVRNQEKKRVIYNELMSKSLTPPLASTQAGKVIGMIVTR